MEYQKIINLLNVTRNQRSKFKTKNWAEINDESGRVYYTSHQIKFKPLMIRSNLCNYSDANIHVKGTITTPNKAATGAAANNANKKVIFKNCAPFTNCISKINDIQIDDAHDIDREMMAQKMLKQWYD